MTVSPCRFAVLSALLVLTACSSSTPDRANGSPTPSSTAPTSLPTASPSSPQGGPLVAALPAGCDGATPVVADTVAFVAQGRAWAVASDGTGLTCMFRVDAPGPFSWGPKG